jgi:NOL1/NOP2/sun family putative RNA methylase
MTFPVSSQARKLARDLGYNEWMVGRYLKYIPNPEGCLMAMRSAVHRYIRINTIKIKIEGLVQRFVTKGVDFERTILKDVLCLRKSPYPLGAMTEYLLGYYYIQDLSSCIAVEALECMENQINLDMASSPGGKTTYMAQRMNNSGIIAALESNPKRIKPLIFNLSRCGVMNTCIYQMSAIEAQKLGQQFDRVLLDAPCSCEGVIAKDPTRKTSLTPSDIKECSYKQMNLIVTAADIVKPGGLLVYSTCTFAPEENEAVVNHLLGQRANVQLEPVRFGEPGLTAFGSLEFDKQLKRTARFYPHIHKTSGFYVAKIRVK